MHATYASYLTCALNRKGQSSPILPVECLRGINIYLNVPETLQVALVPIMQHIAMDKKRSRV